MRYPLTTIVILLLTHSLIRAQAPSNDGCNASITLCDGQKIIGATNKNSISDVSPNGDDGDGTIFGCNIFQRTVWYTFTTNATGGNATLDIDNISCITGSDRSDSLQVVIVTATTPCDASTYTQFGTCQFSNSSFNYNLTGLSANETYYIIIDGITEVLKTQPSECDFDIELSGPAIQHTSVNPKITTESSSICPEETVQVNMDFKSSKNVVAYDWYVNGVFQERTSDTFFVAANLPQGPNTVNLELTYEERGCQITELSPVDSINVQIMSVDAGENQTVLKGQPAKLNGSGSGTLLWSPSVGLNNPAIGNAVSTPNETITYTLTTSIGGCELSDLVTVFVEDLISIPTIITPNGDGYNDEWKISRINYYPQNKVEVFNRWGQKMYSSSGYSETRTWDGTYGGKTVPAATYYYVISLGDENNETFTGQISVIY